jgi:hypothetical protein
VLDPRKCVEVEIEEALTITISNSWRQKISNEALGVATMRTSSPQAKGYPEGRHFGYQGSL